MRDKNEFASYKEGEEPTVDKKHITIFFFTLIAIDLDIAVESILNVCSL